MTVECSVLSGTVISLPPRPREHCGRGGENILRIEECREILCSGCDVAIVMTTFVATCKGPCIEKARK